jgi:arylsulfatase A-like enzyme
MKNIKKLPAKQYLINSLIALLCMAFVSYKSYAQENTTFEFPPNVVLIFVDDVGYGEVGSYGFEQVPTPHIDAIAENGVYFTSGYVSAPFCAPSRAGILTGKFQTRFGYEYNPVGVHNENPEVGLPANQQTIARALVNRGYTTALIGKWHLGGTVNYHPMRRGFDEFYGFLHEGHSYAFPAWKDVTSFVSRRVLPDGSKGVWIGDGVVYSTEEGSYIPVYDANNPILRSSQPVIEVEYLTDAFTREAISFIERKKDQPFFLEVSYNAVHTPNQAANKYMKKFEYIEDMEERIDAAMLNNLDDGVGAIVNKIKETGLEENTIIIFLSDNGAPIIERPKGNGILRGGKGDMYEGGIRVPFVMQWKGIIPAGLVYDKTVSACDIFPTVLAAAGGNIPKDIDGINILPFLTATELEQPARNLFWRMGHQTALISGNWKLVNNQKEKKNWELYNLSKDIAEQNNLFWKNPSKALELKSIWEQFDNEMAEPIFRYR